MKYLSIPLIACALMTAGCSARLGDMTMITTKNVDLSRMNEFVRTGNRVTAKDRYTTLLAMPLGSASIEEATDKAIEQVPGGVALIDVVMREGGWYLFLIGRKGYRVEGEVLIDPAVARQAAL